MEKIDLEVYGVGNNWESEVTTESYSNEEVVWSFEDGKSRILSLPYSKISLEDFMDNEWILRGGDNPLFMSKKNYKNKDKIINGPKEAINDLVGNIKNINEGTEPKVYLSGGGIRKEGTIRMYVGGTLRSGPKILTVSGVPPTNHSISYSKREDLEALVLDNSEKMSEIGIKQA